MAAAAPGAPAAAAVPRQVVCLHCAAPFDSRNALFKHVARCQALQQQQALPSSALEEDEIEDFLALPQNKDKDVYIYATGGRVRGRTLGSVERFSFRKQACRRSSSMVSGARPSRRHSHW